MTTELKIIETYHIDGDQTYYWSTIEEALDSGRFDFMYDEIEGEFELFGETFLGYETFDDLIKDCKDLKDFIEKVGYPFFIEE
jgi:hypothetical protein